MRHLMRTPRETTISYADLVAAGPLLAASCREDRDDYAVAALWNLGRGKRLRVYDLEEGQVFIAAVAVCPASGRSEFAGRGRLRSFGMEDEEDLEGFKPFRYEALHALAYAGDGTLAAVADGSLVRLDASTGERVARWKIPSRLKWERAAFDPLGEKLALAAGTRVEVLDVPD
ncbi:MAG: hypothetical protein K2W96_14030 [Gemmataceae bacterium]|nr:hypothetical protein [Gemmataceae bacterium]